MLKAQVCLLHLIIIHVVPLITGGDRRQLQEAQGSDPADASSIKVDFKINYWQQIWKYLVVGKPCCALLYRINWLQGGPAWVHLGQCRWGEAGRGRWKEKVTNTIKKRQMTQIHWSHFPSQAACPEDDQGNGDEGARADQGQDSRQGGKPKKILCNNQTTQSKVSKKIEDFSENEITSAFQAQCSQLSEWHGDNHLC